MNYDLYLESGPRRRKTMVHVLDLLGCVAQGPTTAEALEATPEAIRSYLLFLLAHGEAVGPEGVFTTTVAEHVMEGYWIGNGDPVPGFAPDFHPLTAQDLSIYLRRLAWLRSDLLELVRKISPESMMAEPQNGGRSFYRILDHLAESSCAYLRYTVGNVEGLAEALRAVQRDPTSLPAALSHLWRVSSARLGAMTDAEREQQVQHGQLTWTARRGLRRTLEHEWEHFMEMSRRLNSSAS